MKKKVASVSVLVLSALAVSLVLSGQARAASSTITVTLTDAANCISQVNGSNGTTTVNVTTGTNVSLNVVNDDPYVSQQVTGPGINEVAPINNKAS